MRARELDPAFEIAALHVASGRLPFAIAFVFLSGTWAGADPLIDEMLLAVCGALE